MEDTYSSLRAATNAAAAWFSSVVHNCDPSSSPLKYPADTRRWMYCGYSGFRRRLSLRAASCNHISWIIHDEVNGDTNRSGRSVEMSGQCCFSILALLIQHLESARLHISYFRVLLCDRDDSHLQSSFLRPSTSTLWFLRVQSNGRISLVDGTFVQLVEHRPCESSSRMTAHLAEEENAPFSVQPGMGATLVDGMVETL